MEPYALVVNAVCQERIWGGNKLLTRFGFKHATEETGEAWVISAHPNGPSTVVNGPYAGKSLAEVVELHPDWFDHLQLGKFPLLLKLLDCRADLSVQVHPDDAYASSFGELGKTECWYIVDAEPGAEIVLGHNAQTREEFRAKVEAGDFETLLRRVPVKQGDFFFVPSGTVHALGKGLLVFETQQSSDVTYRLYDYDRRDAQGNRRELHLESSIQVAICPAESANVNPVITREAGRTRTRFMACEYFTVEKWSIFGKIHELSRSSFTLLTVLHGEGHFLDQTGLTALHPGTSLVIPANCADYAIEGTLEIMVAWI